MIQSLVITRIPYPSSGPKEDRLHFLAGQDVALRKMAQGIGRGIRCETDDVTLWFADPRIPIPLCVTEDTGLLPSPSSKPEMLSTIPSRFSRRFGYDPDAAQIGVDYVKPATAAPHRASTAKSSSTKSSSAKSATRTGQSGKRAAQ